MSWSKSASGTAEAIREQVSYWAGQIAREDAVALHLNSAQKQGHAAQVDAAVTSVDVLAAVYPQKLLSVQAAGHSGEDGAGYVQINYTLLKKGDAPPTAAPPAK